MAPKGKAKAKSSTSKVCKLTMKASSKAKAKAKVQSTKGLPKTDVDDGASISTSKQSWHTYSVELHRAPSDAFVTWGQVGMTVDLNKDCQARAGQAHCIY